MRVVDDINASPHAIPVSGDIRFDNRFTNELPADPTVGPETRQVPGAAFSLVEPVHTANPRLIAWTSDLADELGFDDDFWSTETAAEIFTGNVLLPGSEPYAANYGGHQFGNWAGQLGDGRAIALGEIVDRGGQHQTLQLKGAGPTPYSRRADGLAVLRSSVREFLCSEAMHHLGIPTTRALTLALTGTDVVRDMFYDGNPAAEPGAVVCRVAPSFLRFGTYQLPAARGELDQLRQLADFTIRHYHPHLDLDGGPEVYEAWFDEICRSSCDLVVHWMRVGFVHGVMNTDNMSIHGLTIDYGPYGWLDDYDPNWTPNTTDAGGRRYRFGHQPQITQWNLLQLANALYPLVERAEGFEASLSGFAERFTTGFRSMMLDKLGLAERPVSDGFDDGAADEDDELIGELTDVLQLAETDMTIFFRLLAKPGLSLQTLEDAYYEPGALGSDESARIEAWLDRYRARIGDDKRSDDDRFAAMNSVNPNYVLRNYLAQQAIDAAETGDYSLVTTLATVLRRPYDEQPAAAEYSKKRPDWARSRPGCSMLSCSS
ncbi:MAG: protein adenylyltransferase SelO [Acidimicrobiales bacterium]